MTSRKRIVFLASHLLSPSVASGGDILFCELAARIAKRRPEWEIAVLAPDFARAELALFFERVVTFPTGRREGRQGSPASVALTWRSRLKSATEILASLRPDLVHSTGDFFVDVWPVAAAKRRVDLKWSGVVHHVNAPPLRRQNDLAVAIVSYALQRGSFRALRAADSISVLNHQVRSELERLHFDPRRVHVVGAGIDVSRFAVAPASNRARRAVWLNRLEPTKGLFDLPEILHSLPDDISIDVIGRAPEVHIARLKRALEKAGVVDRCVLHGFLPEEQVREVLARAGVFISCSYEEGWGISIAEALAMGLPCVAYDLPSHREIFGTAIQRVPIGDTAAFAKKIEDALESPDSDGVRAARREAAGRFSLEECARRQEEIFASLIA